MGAIKTYAELWEEFKKLRAELIETHQITCKSFTEFVTTEDDFFDDPEGVELIRETYQGRNADYHLTELLIRYKNEMPCLK